MSTCRTVCRPVEIESTNGPFTAAFALRKHGWRIPTSRERRVLAFANQKGGVEDDVHAEPGRRARRRELRVLCVDMDPQGNLTMSQGLNPDSIERSMFDVLVHRMPIENVIYKTEIDIAVSSSTSPARSSRMSSMIGRERALEKALAPLLGEYEYILIDTAVARAADHQCPGRLRRRDRAGAVRVPVAARPVQLENTLAMIRENLNPKVGIVGILPTMYDRRTLHTREAVEILEENFGDLVFNTRHQEDHPVCRGAREGLLGPQIRPERERGRRLSPAQGGAQWPESAPACVRACRGALPRDGSLSAAPGRARARRAGARRRAARRHGRARPAARRGSGSRRRSPRPRQLQSRSRAALSCVRSRRLATKRCPSPRRALHRAPSAEPGQYLAVIRVVGVGGAGLNAVNRMIDAGISDVEFVAVNIDIQQPPLPGRADEDPYRRERRKPPAPRSTSAVALLKKPTTRSSALCAARTWSSSRGRRGRRHRLGAAPIVGRISREVGALTVGIVTLPFHFEGTKRKGQADQGVAELRENCDTVIVIPNDCLLAVLGSFDLDARRVPHRGRRLAPGCPGHHRPDHDAGPDQPGLRRRSARS